jgi:hypothetical protein
MNPTRVVIDGHTVDIGSAEWHDAAYRARISSRRAQGRPVDLPEHCAARRAIAAAARPTPAR